MITALQRVQSLLHKRFMLLTIIPLIPGCIPGGPRMPGGGIPGGGPPRPIMGGGIPGGGMPGGGRLKGACPGAGN